MNSPTAFPGTTLKLGDEPEVLQPTMAALYDAIRRMKPTGPSFVVVARASGDYAQAGGGNGEFSVEWREYGEPFIHLLAGKGTPTEEAHIVQMQDGHTEVLKHEVLGMEDVKTLLGAFLRDGRRPPGYLWRNVTYAFMRKQPTRDITEL
jgi:hypothetical protein